MTNLAKLIQGSFPIVYTPDHISGRGEFKQGKTDDGKTYVLFDNSDRIFREIVDGRDMDMTEDQLAILCYKSMINSIMEIIYSFEGEIIPRNNKE